MVVIGLLEYSHCKNMNFKLCDEDNLWIRMQQGYIYRKQQWDDAFGASHAPHEKDTPGSYLTTQHFCKVLLQTPRNILIPINMYDALSGSSKWIISGKSVLITEGLLTNTSKNCGTFPSWPK